MSEKCFIKEFDKFLNMIQSGENFVFTRFSDGEYFILRNHMVVLADNFFVTGDRIGQGVYTAEEQKEFYPDRHQFYRDKLTECFKHKQKNYFKGICTKGDVEEEGFLWQLELHGNEDSEHLTFANVLINNNYKRYIEELIPLLKDKKVMYIVNELADLSDLPFPIVKDFRIGSNCMIDNYDTVEEVKSYIKENNIKDHIIISAAASLSNFIAYECFKENDQNTFLDIGSTLNPYLKLEGWKHTRGYLTHYWLDSGSPYGTKIDYW